MEVYLLVCAVSLSVALVAFAVVALVDWLLGGPGGGIHVVQAETPRPHEEIDREEGRAEEEVRKEEG